MNTTQFLTFPDDRASGELRLAHADDYGAWVAKMPPLGAARGDVAVPTEVPLCFVADAACTAADLRRLDWLTGDDFLDLAAVEDAAGVIAALPGLPRLRRVRLPRRTVDAHLDILRALPALRELVLRRTAITDAGTRHLRALPDVRRLDLARTRLTTSGIVPLARLSALELLDLRFTHVGDEALFYLRALANLRVLHLASYHRTRVSDLGVDGVTDIGLGYLRPLQLETLTLSSQAVTDAGIAVLDGMTRMRRLALPTAITDVGLAHLAPHARLERLTVRGCRGITDAGVAHLAGKTALGFLDLAGTGVSDGGTPHLASLTTLRTLLLGGTGVGDAGVARLLPLRRLESLDLAQCAVTNASLAAAAAFPALRKLNVLDPRGAKITGEGLAELLPLLHLAQLSVGGCRLNIAGMVYLGSQLGLRHLDATNTYLTDNRLEKVRPFPHLHTLVLLSNPITDAGISLLAGLPALRRVYLGYTEVSEQGVLALRKQRPDVRVSYSPPAMPTVSWDADE